MTKQIFINLPVRDIQRSMDFYAALGFTNNLQFTDHTGKCMVWSKHIFMMILSLEKFNSFTAKPLSDTASTIAGLFSLPVENIQAVNHMMTKGLEAGGTEPNEMRDYGFMQQRTIEDPDDHTCERFRMDMSTFPAHTPIT